MRIACKPESADNPTTVEAWVGKPARKRFVRPALQAKSDTFHALVITAALATFTLLVIL